jgi:hypothetical protein
MWSSVFGVVSLIGDLVDARLARRGVADTVGEGSQGERSRGVGNWKQDETEASGRPRNIGLNAAVEAGTVAAFLITALEA